MTTFRSLSNAKTWALLLLALPFISLAQPIPSSIRDADGNTRVQTEKFTNENIIRFDLSESEKMVLRQNTGGIPKITFMAQLITGLGGRCLDIQGGDSSKCIDVQGGVDNNGIPIILWTKHGGQNQKWNLVPSNIQGHMLPDFSYCFKCRQLFFSGQNSKILGVCPAGGKHNNNGSGWYSVATPGGSPAPYIGQDRWAICLKCNSAFYYDGKSTNGHCPAGGEHFTNPVPLPGPVIFPLSIRMNQGQDPNYQSGWSWCSKCQGLYFREMVDQQSARQGVYILTVARQPILYSLM